MIPDLVLLGMGETRMFQPLTREDRVTVVLYRAGIVLSTLIICLAAYMALGFRSYEETGALNLTLNAVLVCISISVGLSVFFIHLYVGKFHRVLKKLYYVAIASLALLFILGNGDGAAVLLHKGYGPLFLIPLSGCLGFITAKEAFCFQLMEGYLLALTMPLFLLLTSLGVVTQKSISYGLLLIAGMLALFTLRKVFMPIHYDIGDKSAYT
ncbi:MAG TPA: DUF2301 domain-containing membrane protein [Thermodesulfovibrionales bacterium]|jgi:uncharacterized integral membrane protein|nr:DUF2301 domain-containing membrane protein [Thermodesulfovibrionales bacterium]